MAGWRKTSEPPQDGWRYLIALGSNMRHHRHGSPERILRAAIGALDGEELGLGIAAPRMRSRPIGPSQRDYANTVALVVSRLDPPAVLARLQVIEDDFGRRRARRWGARVLDLDIVLWSGGCWRSRGLAIPHVAFRARDFVLKPAVWLAPAWRDPCTGLTLRQLMVRNHAGKPLRARARWQPTPRLDPEPPPP